MSQLKYHLYRYKLKPTDNFKNVYQIERASHIISVRVIDENGNRFDSPLIGLQPFELKYLVQKTLEYIKDHYLKNHS